jgi:hypothetical protein
MDPLGFGRIIAENWDILKMYPGAFWSVLGFGFVIGLAITRIFLNERLTRQQMRISDLQSVLDGKLPHHLLPPAKRNRPMSFLILGGLVLAFVGIVIAIGGVVWQMRTATQVNASATQTSPSVSTSKHTPVAIDHGTAIDTPIPPVIQPPPPISNSPVFGGLDKDGQRKIMLENRGKLELGARDAAGTPVRVEIVGQSGIAVLRVKDGETEYQVQVGVAGPLGAFIFPASSSSKPLYISTIMDHGKPIDIRQLRYSKGSDNFRIGEHAFAVLPDGKMLQLILVGVQSYRDGDDIDELRFKYKIHPADEFLFDSL